MTIFPYNSYWTTGPSVDTTNAREFLLKEGAISQDTAIDVDDGEFKQYMTKCATYSKYIQITPESKFYYNQELMDRKTKFWRYFFKR
jgi:hypothetical protein